MKFTWTRNRYPARLDLFPTLLIGASWFALWLVWPRPQVPDFVPLRPFTAIHYTPSLSEGRPIAAAVAPLPVSVAAPELKDSQFINLLKTHPYDFTAFVPPAGDTREYELPEKPLVERAGLDAQMYKPEFKREREPLPLVERPLLDIQISNGLEGLKMELPESISALKSGPAWRISARVETDVTGQVREAFLMSVVGEQKFATEALTAIRRARLTESTGVRAGLVTISFAGVDDPAPAKENGKSDENPD